MKIEPYLMQYAENRIKRLQKDQSWLMENLPPQKRELVRRQIRGRILELERMIREVKRGRL